MNNKDTVSRREFLTTLSVAAPVAALGNAAAAAHAATGKDNSFEIIGFTKPFQRLSFEDTADVVAEVGWDGIECPVRKGGQVLPERAADDLPALVESLRRRKRELVIMATDVWDASDPLAQIVLRAASKLGIRYYRLAHQKYDSSKPIPEQLNELRVELRDLIALNRELGMCACYQNHSGNATVGAPVWDVYELIKDLDHRHIGVCFDIGHATVEGGYAWPLHAQLMSPLFRAVYVKDFTWQRTDNGWRAQWRPLGEGMINKSFFNWLKESGFQGPICQHHEYPVGSGSDMIRVMRKDRETLLDWLDSAI